MSKNGSIKASRILRPGRALTPDARARRAAVLAEMELYELKPVSASYAKAHILELMERVNKTGVPIVITKRGIPCAQLTPPARKKRRSLVGSVKTLSGDVLSTNVKWKALE